MVKLLLIDWNSKLKMADYTSAYDTIFGEVNSAWIANAPLILGSTPNIYWQGVENVGKVNQNDYHVEVAQLNINSGQAGFGGPTKTYETNGILTISLFCPLSKSNSTEKGRQLAEILRDSVRGKTVSGILFRNTTITGPETNQDKSFIVFTITSDYRYDEFV